jgi:hypothetical protein
MTPWGCAFRSTADAAGTLARSQDGSTNAFEEGSVPKITRHGGPTTELNDEVAEVEGGDESSLGTSSSTSEEKQPTASATSRTGRRKPARTTASRSVKDPAESGSAASTDGSTPATG